MNHYGRSHSIKAMACGRLASHSGRFAPQKRPLEVAICTGLKVICKLDNNNYETGKKYTEEQKESLNIEYTGPNKEWNYIIRPNE